MQVIIEGIRKIVVLVLLMELVLQLQVGKEYEPYVKMLVGIMVVYSLVAGIIGVFSGVEKMLVPMQEMEWTGEWLWEFEGQAEAFTEQNVEYYGPEGAEKEAKEMVGTIEVQSRIIAVPEVKIEEIKIEEFDITGGRQ